MWIVQVASVPLTPSSHGRAHSPEADEVFPTMVAIVCIVVIVAVVLAIVAHTRRNAD